MEGTDMLTAQRGNSPMHTMIFSRQSICLAAIIWTGTMKTAGQRFNT